MALAQYEILNTTLVNFGKLIPSAATFVRMFEHPDDTKKMIIEVEYNGANTNEFKQILIRPSRAMREMRYIDGRSAVWIYKHCDTETYPWPVKTHSFRAALINGA